MFNAVTHITVDWCIQSAAPSLKMYCVETVNSYSALNVFRITGGCSD